MAIFAFLARLNQKRKLGRLSLRLARQSEAAFWEEIKRRVGGMDPAEARSYVETRAAQFVHPQVDRLLKQHPRLDAADGPALIVKSAEALTALIVTHRLKAIPRHGPKAA